MKKNIFSIIMISFLLLLSLTGCEESEEVKIYENSTQVQQESESDRQYTETTVTEKSEIYVYICGAVRNPGVVSLPAGSRVFEAVEQAGGFTEEASMTAVNQAAELTDGQQIVVLTKEEATAVPGTESGMDASGGKINLNQATREELMSLPGIGEAKAADIIEYREQAGPFQRIEQIKEINGIKDAVFEKIKDKIVV